MIEEMRSLHKVNIEIDSAGNWVSESELDARDAHGGLKNNQTVKRRETMADIQTWSVTAREGTL